MSCTTDKSKFKDSAAVKLESIRELALFRLCLALVNVISKPVSDFWYQHLAVRKEIRGFRRSCKALRSNFELSRTKNFDSSNVIDYLWEPERELP